MTLRRLGLESSLGLTRQFMVRPLGCLLIWAFVLGNPGGTLLLTEEVLGGEKYPPHGGLAVVVALPACILLWADTDSFAGHQQLSQMWASRAKPTGRTQRV